MAVLKFNFLCPTEHFAEMAKLAPEITPKFPPPDYVTMRGPYFKSTYEGMNWFFLCEVESSKMYEERTRLAAIGMALHGVPGLKWNIEYWTEPADAQKRIEMYGA